VILTIVVVIGLSLAALLVFVSVAGMIAGPFNELLSEAVEARLTGTPGAPFLARGVPPRRRARHRPRAAPARDRARRGAPDGRARLHPGRRDDRGRRDRLWLAGARRGVRRVRRGAVAARAAVPRQARLPRSPPQPELGLGLAIAGMLLVPGLNLVALGLGAAGATLAAHELAARPTPPTQNKA